jgi:hypothetical protein
VKDLKKKSLGTRLREHDRLLTIAGAALLFVTFVVKEGIKEHWKELSDSVQNADNLFVIRSDARRLGQLVVEEGRNGPNDSPPIPQFHSSGTNDVIVLDQLIETSTVDLRQARARIDDVVGLMEELPVDEFRAKLFHEVVSELEHREDQETAPLAFFRKKNHHTIQPRTNYEIFTDVRFTRRLDELERGVVDQAKALRDQSRSNYGVAKWVSYFLYSVALILAVVGKLYDVKGLELVD